MESIVFINLILVTAILSFLYSGSETAFLTAQRAKIVVWIEQKRLFSTVLQRYINNPERYLISSLVGNNFVNIAYSSLGTLLLLDYFTENEIVILLAIVILVFCESLPKVIFSSFSDNLILYASAFIRISEIIFFPVIVLAHTISSRLMRKRMLKESEARAIYSIHDIDHVIHESHQVGKMEDEVKSYMKQIIQLKNNKIKEIMMHRSEIIAVDIKDSRAKMLKTFHDNAYTRLPIYQDTIDNILGYIFFLDLLDDKRNINDLIQKIPIYPKTKSIKDSLLIMKRERQSIALVIDEHGGTAGLLLLDSIMEFIVGDLDDEFTTNAKELFRISKNTYKVAGSTSKEDLEKLGLRLPKADYETVAGMIISRLQRFPKQDEIIEFSGFKLIVIQSKKVKIEWVLLKIDS